MFFIFVFYYLLHNKNSIFRLQNQFLNYPQITILQIDFHYAMTSGVKLRIVMNENARAGENKMHRIHKKTGRWRMLCLSSKISSKRSSSTVIQFIDSEESRKQLNEGRPLQKHFSHDRWRDSSVIHRYKFKLRVSRYLLRRIGDHPHKKNKDRNRKTQSSNRSIIRDLPETKHAWEVRHGLWHKTIWWNAKSHRLDIRVRNGMRKIRNPKRRKKDQEFEEIFGKNSIRMVPDKSAEWWRIQVGKLEGGISKSF